MKNGKPLDQHIADLVQQDRREFRANPPDTILAEQIRMIVREELAAQKERLFEEAREYNIKTNLALFAEAEKLQSLEATSDDTSQGQL